MTGSRYQFSETADKRVVLFGCIEQRFWDKCAIAAGRKDLVGRQADRPNRSVDWGSDTAREIIAEVALEGVAAARLRGQRTQPPLG